MAERLANMSSKLGSRDERERGNIQEIYGHSGLFSRFRICEISSLISAKISGFHESAVRDFRVVLNPSVCSDNIIAIAN